MKKVKTYHKLVRDFIPKMIEESGKEAKVEILDEVEYQKKLNEKLIEECQEWIESGAIEEIADILEVLRAIAKMKGCDWDDVERICLEKREERGGFDQRVLLVQTEEIN
jgi:predicted house-cleaning noncanonical NTP pyrophosphatase (MazG superfamily)